MKYIYNKLLEKIDKSQIFLNEPMSKHTSFKIGGPADIFIKAKSIEEIKYILEVAKKDKIPLNIIGNGTNVLVKDKGIRGIVLKLGINKVDIEKNIIIAEAGVLISKLANIACQNSLSGLEFTSGIPGTIGGAIRMNAGAYGNEMQDIVLETTYIDRNLNINKINLPDHKFEYRNSIFNINNWIILSTKLQLQFGDKEEIKNKMNENMSLRKSKQPLNFPNAGSIFKRKETYITAKLIDECGLKGYNINDAYISDIHAGFIVNKGNATAQDIIRLIDLIKQKVYEKFGKQIELEIEILGED